MYACCLVFLFYFFLIPVFKNGRGGSCSFVGSLVQLVSLILKVTMSLTRKTLNCYNSSNFNIVINHITNHLLGATENHSNLSNILRLSLMDKN